VETATAKSFCEAMFQLHKARSLRFVHFKKTEADLLPDLEKQTTTIRLHHSANVMSDKVNEKTIP
jgi:hypothetical protein